MDTCARAGSRTSAPPEAVTVLLDSLVRPLLIPFRLPLCLLLLLGFVPGLPANSQPLALPSEAHEVLNRFVGDWDVMVTINGQRHEGQARATWTMEGTHVEFRSHTIPPGDSELQVMTFADGVYHQWMFDSSGYRHYVTGTWNPTTRTLVWRGDDLLIEDHWVNPDRLEWSTTRADRKLTGVVCRRGLPVDTKP